MKHLKLFEQSSNLIENQIFEKSETLNVHQTSYEIVELVKVLYLEDCKNFTNINHYYQDEKRRTIAIKFNFIQEETITLIRKIQNNLNLPKWYINNNTYSFDITHINVKYIIEKLELLSSAKKYNL